MNALELLESLPTFPKGFADKGLDMDRVSRDLFLNLGLIDSRGEGCFERYRRTPLGDWLLAKIKEQDA
jgi:hypothetical protein